MAGRRPWPMFLLGWLLAWPLAAQPAPTAAALYRTHCAGCHGARRLGGMGPALLPQNLVRLSRARARQVIRDGRADTQMPAFGRRLTADAIARLVDYIYRPPARPPRWDRAAMMATHREPHPRASLPAHPTYQADMQNLFVVVELGDHHVTLLDGDRLVPITRFASHRALHGGPKFSPDGRFVFFASRDGWITEYDLYSLQTVAEIRAGINTRNLAVSGDGRYVMVANYLPHTLVLLDARDLTPLRIFPVRDRNGRSSRVSAVYTAPPRHSFIAALKDVPEIWEIPYDREAVALPVYRGPRHDYRRESGEAPLLDRNRFPVRRIALAEPMDDFFFDPAYLNLIGAVRGGHGRVINLVTGARVADLDLDGMPHLGSGITWDYRGHPVLATPNLKKAEISIIDMTTWKTIERIPTQGPGFFIRSHENTPYAWTDVFFGPHRDLVDVIDKRTLKIVKVLRPAPGKTSAHVEFDRHGRYALLSIWDRKGAVVVYDAATLKEIKRLPMCKPSGKYNVYNKTHYSRGTSH